MHNKDSRLDYYCLFAKVLMYYRILLSSGTRRSEEDNILEDDKERLLLVFEVLSFLYFFKAFISMHFSSLISDRKSIYDIDDNEL